MNKLAISWSCTTFSANTKIRSANKPDHRELLTSRKSNLTRAQQWAGRGSWLVEPRNGRRLDAGWWTGADEWHPHGLCRRFIMACHMRRILDGRIYTLGGFSDSQPIVEVSYLVVRILSVSLPRPGVISSFWQTLGSGLFGVNYHASNHIRAWVWISQSSSSSHTATSVWVVTHIWCTNIQQIKKT